MAGLTKDLSGYYICAGSSPASRTTLTPRAVLVLGVSFFLEGLVGDGTKGDFLTKF